MIDDGVHVIVTLDLPPASIIENYTWLRDLQHNIVLDTR